MWIGYFLCKIWMTIKKKIYSIINFLASQTRYLLCVFSGISGESCVNFKSMWLQYVLMMSVQPKFKQNIFFFLSFFNYYFICVCMCLCVFLTLAGKFFQKCIKNFVPSFFFWATVILFKCWYSRFSRFVHRCFNSSIRNFNARLICRDTYDKIALM